MSVTPAQGLLLVGALVTARSSAMGFNRLVDRDIDARNPRTASREIPSGQISVAAAWAFTISSALLFALCCALLGRTVLYLCPVALAIVWGYSLTKRFTALCHAVLGVALALAPAPATTIRVREPSWPMARGSGEASRAAVPADRPIVRVASDRPNRPTRRAA